MRLFNKTIDRQLFKQYPLGSDLEKQDAVVKIFNPTGRGNWFILNSDPEDPDYLWAIVDLGYGAEIGSVSRSELESYRGRLGLGFERDLSFDPINAEELYKGLRAGKYFAKGGEVSFIKYNDSEIMYEPHYDKYYANDVEFDSLQKAKDFIDSKETDAGIRDAYSKGMFADGGALGDEVVLAKSYGYYDLSKYSYGNDFKRFVEPTKAKFIKGTIKIGGQIRAVLEDGREIITDKQAIDLPTYEQKDDLYQKNKHLFSFGYADGGLILSNQEIIKDIVFEDNTDLKHGRYDFSFNTVDKEGAPILDYDGYIIEEPSSSRRDNEIEWGQNTPEDWDGAETILQNAFSDWKQKQFSNGGGIDKNADLYGKDVAEILFLKNKGYAQAFNIAYSFKFLKFDVKMTQAVNLKRSTARNLGIAYFVGIDNNPNEETQISREMLEAINDNSNATNIVLYTNAGVDLHSEEKGVYKKIKVVRVPFNKIKSNSSFANGGNLEDLSDNQRMIMNQNVELEHHHEELEDVLEDKIAVPAWVVAKMATATQSVSDITHYLDGQKELMEDEDEVKSNEFSPVDVDDDDEVKSSEFFPVDEDDDELENKEVVEPINVSAGTKAELTKKFTDDAWGNLRGFLKGKNQIDLRDDYTFDYDGQQYEVEPIISSDDNGVSNAVFTIFDGDSNEVGDVAYSRDGGKQKFTANSEFFSWNNTKFEDGGFMNDVYAHGGSVVKETQVFKDLGDMYVVNLWKGQWTPISRHKFKVDAQEISKMIESGSSTEEVQLRIKEQSKNGLSEYVAKQIGNKFKDGGFINGVYAKGGEILLRKDLIQEFYDENGLDSYNASSMKNHSIIDGHEVVTESQAYADLGYWQSLYPDLKDYVLRKSDVYADRGSIKDNVGIYKLKTPKGVYYEIVSKNSNNNLMTNRNGRVFYINKYNPSQDYSNWEKLSFVDLPQYLQKNYLAEHNHIIKDAEKYSKGGEIEQGQEVGLKFDSEFHKDKLDVFVVEKIENGNYHLRGKKNGNTYSVPKERIVVYSFAKGGEIAKAEILGLKRNIMGTTDIEMKISGMRKPQDFIVYPIGKDDAGSVITIQSDTRIGQINLVKGVGVMSQSHSSGAYFVHLQMDKLTSFTINEKDLEDLKINIYKTAGDNVGTRGIVSDNSGASRIFADGGFMTKVYDNGGEVGGLVNANEWGDVKELTKDLKKAKQVCDSFKKTGGLESIVVTDTYKMYYVLARPIHKLKSKRVYADGGDIDVEYWLTKNKEFGKPKWQSQESQDFNEVFNEVIDVYNRMLDLYDEPKVTSEENKQIKELGQKFFKIKGFVTFNIVEGMANKIIKPRLKLVYYSNGGDLNSMTKYQLEKELKSLNERKDGLSRKYGNFPNDEAEEINNKIDKIITLLYGENFSGKGQKFKYAEGGDLGKYEGEKDFDVRSYDQLKIDDVLDREKPIKLYKEQVLPINSPYADNYTFWISPKDITIIEGYGSIYIKKGDKLFLRVANPVNGDPSSDTSYKVVVDNKEYPLLHFIPETAEGGDLDDKNHYDAITQLKNLDGVLVGKIETPAQAEERKIKIAEALIPNNDFYVSKPYHSGGFESPQKVIFKNNRWLRLREDKWITKQDYEKMTNRKDTDFDEDQFNIWGEFETKYDLAWDIVKNARVILNDKLREGINEKWNKQYDFLTLENKKQYASQSKKNKLENGGDFNDFDAIAYAKTKGRESIDWNKELREYAGNDYPNLTDKEKEEIISDLQRDGDVSNSYANGGGIGFIPMDLEETLRITAKWGGTDIKGVIGILNAMIDSGFTDEDLKPAPTKTGFAHQKAIDKKTEEIWAKIKPNYKGDLQGNMYWSTIHRLVDRANSRDEILKRFKPYRHYQKDAFADGGDITPALNSKVIERAEKIYAEMNGKTKEDFDKAYFKAIIEFGYSPAVFIEKMEKIGQVEEYDDENFAKGGSLEDKLTKLENKKSDLESKLFDAQLKSNTVMNNIGFGAGMRRSKVSFSTSREDSLKERIIVVEKEIEQLKESLLPKKPKYILKADIKTVTLKRNGKEATYKGSDVYNGANMLSNGGDITSDLTSKANYIPKRDVVEVELKDGSKIKPVNGYWLKKGAEPIGANQTNTSSQKYNAVAFDGKKQMSHLTDKQYSDKIELFIKENEKKGFEVIVDLMNNGKSEQQVYKTSSSASNQTKVGETYIRKDARGNWKAETNVDNFNNYDWRISTIKTYSGKLISSAQGGKTESTGTKGIVMFKYVMYEDPNYTLEVSVPKRLTDKVVSEQHEKALAKFKKFMETGMFKGGGKISNFDKLSAKVAKQYEGKAVKNPYQEEYGKYYSKEEAQEVGDKVAGKIKENSKDSGENKTTLGHKGKEMFKQATILAKEIRKEGESWQDAKKRAFSQLKK
jgi:hypothetical protein